MSSILRPPTATSTFSQSWRTTAEEEEEIRSNNGKGRNTTIALQVTGLNNRQNCKYFRACCGIGIINSESVATCEAVYVCSNSNNRCCCNNKSNSNNSNINDFQNFRAPSESSAPPCLRRRRGRGPPLLRPGLLLPGRRQQRRGHPPCLPRGRPPPQHRRHRR